MEYKNEFISNDKRKYLDKVAKEIEELYRGHTKDDSEYLFSKILPIYLFQSRTLKEKADYKIIDRKTGEEVKTPSSYHPL